MVPIVPRARTHADTFPRSHLVDNLAATYLKIYFTRPTKIDCPRRGPLFNKANETHRMRYTGHSYSWMADFVTMPACQAVIIATQDCIPGIDTRTHVRILGSLIGKANMCHGPCQPQQINLHTRPTPYPASSSSFSLTSMYSPRPPSSLPPSPTTPNS